MSSASLPRRDFFFILRAFHQPPSRAQTFLVECPGFCGAKMGKRRWARWTEGGGNWVCSMRGSTVESKNIQHLLSSKCFFKSYGYKKKQDRQNFSIAHIQGVWIAEEEKLLQCVATCFELQSLQHFFSFLFFPFLFFFGRHEEMRKDWNCFLIT